MIEDKRCFKHDLINQIFNSAYSTCLFPNYRLFDLHQSPIVCFNKKKTIKEVYQSPSLFHNKKKQLKKSI